MSIQSNRNSLALLGEAVESNNSVLCCGLDPDVGRLPTELCFQTNGAKAILTFLKEIIDIAAQHVCAFKAQKAFFDCHPEGYLLLSETIKYVHDVYPHLPIFIDAKIGDVENTMAIYLKTILDDLGADGVVVNPYLGDSVLGPFAERPLKAAIVTVRTSNQSAASIQDALMFDGEPLWKHILGSVTNRWNDAKNMIPVIASTSSIDLRSVRASIPDEMPVLFAGVGSQGGDVSRLYDLTNSDGGGVLVNMSRTLLYPYDRDDRGWRDDVERALLSSKRSLNFHRSRSRLLLIAGVSGAGKSTTINEIRKCDEQFEYISPFVTRPLRPGETDKISVGNDTFDDYVAGNRFLLVNELYGVRYGTPRDSIESAIEEGKTPILDWPIAKVNLLKSAFPNRVYCVYLEPANIEIVRERLSDGRDFDHRRLESAILELREFNKGVYDQVINFKCVSEENTLRQSALRIIKAFAAEEL